MTVDHIIEEIDKRVGVYTENVLNPDRAPHMRDWELQRRLELINLRDHIQRQRGLK